ncbi:hypothetical protein P7K49_004783 [Saguinus oedipus]|uniref:Uncharacterized protein n=1 Tax=Saguinus oedipus TaxID=9490 RepID=A0ABQ9W8F1_SAGOE|nr:hypothetical protein P7K49_004783 [Saguinus oedipus]
MGMVMITVPLALLIDSRVTQAGTLTLERVDQEAVRTSWYQWWRPLAFSGSSSSPGCNSCYRMVVVILLLGILCAWVFAHFLCLALEPPTESEPACPSNGVYFFLLQLAKADFGYANKNSNST